MSDRHAELAGLLRQPSTPSSVAPEVGVRPAVVTRSDAGGVFVVVIGSATDTPLGPCRAATYRPGGTGTPVRLPVGTAVLVASTATGPWIVRHELL